MVTAMQKLGVFVAFLALAIGAVAQNTSVLGSWKGHMVVDRSKVPPAKSAADKALMDKRIAGGLSLTFNLSFTNDGHFKLLTHFPKSDLGPGSDATQEGAWVQKGNAVTCDFQTVNGKKTDRHTRTMTLRKGGKELVSGTFEASARILYVRSK